MYAKLQGLINEQASHFMAGRIQAILPLYAPVLPVYIAGNRLTLEDPEQIAETLNWHRTAVLREGFDRLSGRLVAQSIPRGGRFRAMVDWTYDHRAGFQGPTGRSIYFCRLETWGPVIEMMDYPMLAFESACDWYASRLEPELRTGT